MIQNYNYHIWFKVCRMPRIRYKLSTNCLLVLNGCYVLSIILGKGYTTTKLRQFLNYYNQTKVKVYIKVLLDRKFIGISYTKGAYIYYNITQLGIKVISDLNTSYEIELRKFLDLYNIVL